MTKELGTFQRISDPRRNGACYQNEHGLDWQRFVFSRILFNDFGGVIELYVDTASNETITGNRTFAAVVDGVVTSVVNRDVSALISSLPALIVETDVAIATGMLYENGEFFAPAPPPRVVYKNEIMSALTDENYASWDEAWAKAPAKQRIMWDNSLSYTEGTDDYRSAQSLLLALIGTDAYNFFPK